MRNKVSGLIVTVLLGSTFLGCSKEDISLNSPPDLSSVNYTILTSEIELIPDIVKEGQKDSFRLYKVDLPNGSYALLDSAYSKNEKALHFYIGEGTWINVEGDTPNDPWKKQLKSELLKKLSEGKIGSEGVIYNSEGFL